MQSVTFSTCIVFRHHSHLDDQRMHVQGVLKSPRGDERVVLKKVKARVEVS